MPTNFKRKAYAQLREWKDKLADKYALLIEGARRVGKTHLVQEFVGKEYESSIFIDFSRKGRLVQESKKAFTEEDDIKGTLERLQTIHRVSLIPGRSCVGLQCFFLCIMQKFIKRAKNRATSHGFHMILTCMEEKEENMIGMTVRSVQLGTVG